MTCHTCVLTGGQFKSLSPFESMTEFGRGGSGWGYFTAGGGTEWSAKTSEEVRKKVQDFFCIAKLTPKIDNHRCKKQDEESEGECHKSPAAVRGAGTA